MTFRYQAMIKRTDLIGNPDVIYLFGDNWQRKGLGGQAKEMRGEPNARGIRTKKAPSMAPDAFFSDVEAEQNNLMIDNDMIGLWEFLSTGGDVVCPLMGLGSGLSNLALHAPRTFAYLNQQIARLEDYFGAKRNDQRLAWVSKYQAMRGNY